MLLLKAQNQPFLTKPKLSLGFQTVILRGIDWPFTNKNVIHFVSDVQHLKFCSHRNYLPLKISKRLVFNYRINLNFNPFMPIEFPIFIKWTGQFPFKGSIFQFYSNFKRTFS